MPLSEPLSGPFTVIYIKEYPKSYELESKEYSSIEAINAFVDGKGLQPEEYVVVQGQRLSSATLLAKGD